MLKRVSGRAARERDSMNAPRGWESDDSLWLPSGNLQMPAVHSFLTIIEHKGHKVSERGDVHTGGLVA